MVQLTTGASPARVSALERSQLRHSVEAAIRDMIIAGHARPGELLRLAPLAEQMDTSVTPVREALILLAQDGWVVQEANRGFRVAPIRRSDVEDTYFVYEGVAGELARRAAVRATEADIEELRALNARLEGLRRSDNVEAERLNYQVHRKVYEVADSRRLEWFVEAAVRFLPREFWATIPGWRAFNRTAHGPIIAFIAERRPDEAAEAMSSHLHAARRLLVKHLDSISFWS